MYKLKFHELALKEWGKLDSTVREQFKRKLAERLIEPRIEKDRLRTVENAYKIKLRSAGYRLVYLVKDDELCLLAIAVGKRDKKAVYKKMLERF